MKLNKLEFFLMNNSIRKLIQRKYEMKILYKMASSNPIATVLEIGCGNGNGTKLIDEFFSPRQIFAIDLDEKMIEIAYKNCKSKNVSFQAMDATELQFHDNYFDAVFDFGIIHHIPDWESVVKQIHRVLKPNGQFFSEELSIETFSNGLGSIYKILLDHPYDYMFTKKEFKESLVKNGFEINNYKELNPFGLIRHISLNATKK